MLLHEQYETRDGDPVYFECAECGFRSQSLGTLHAHVERHRGYTRFNIQVPFTKTSPANVSELMRWTNVVKVTGTEHVSLDDVNGL